MPQVVFRNEVEKLWISKQEQFFSTLEKVDMTKNYHEKVFAIWTFCYLWIPPQEFWAISRAKRLVFFSKASQASFKYERAQYEILRNVFFLTETTF